MLIDVIMEKNKQDKPLYCYSISKENKITCKECLCYTIETDKRGEKYYKVYTKTRTENVYEYDAIDKFRYGRVWSFSNDKTYIWDIFAKYLYHSMGDAAAKANSARDRFFDFKKKNPDPRREAAENV